jgi:hypothetical protein
MIVSCDSACAHACWSLIMFADSIVQVQVHVSGALAVTHSPFTFIHSHSKQHHLIHSGARF